ncbi:MAG: hypothetical protein K6F77_08780, partial [Lachnospiraceae bacterium]|nr:hypothetical protein [Lachnospiraceae bacterium]
MKIENINKTNMIREKESQKMNNEVKLLLDAIKRDISDLIKEINTLLNQNNYILSVNNGSKFLDNSNHYIWDSFKLEDYRKIPVKKIGEMTDTIKKEMIPNLSELVKMNVYLKINNKLDTIVCVCDYDKYPKYLNKIVLYYPKKGRFREGKEAENGALVCRNKINYENTENLLYGYLIP